MLFLAAAPHGPPSGHHYLALVCSVAAALALGGSAVLQHSAAAAHPDLSTARLVRRLVTTPRWLAGRSFDLLALVLHAIALRHGPLVLVQAVLATSLLAAFAIGAIAGHHRLSASEWTAAAAVAGGVLVLLRVGDPRGGATPSFGDWVTVLLVCSAGTVVVLAVLPRLSATKQAAALGLMAGVLFAVDAAFLKAALAVSPRFGWTAPFHRWESLAFLATALVGNLLIARAFQRAPLTASLPGVTAAEPLTAIVVGLAFFSEHLRPGTVARTVEVLAVAALVVGVVHLSRSRVMADLDVHDVHEEVPSI